ncbi:MAG TPA: nucleotidyltransferase family protein [Stellaceae bacterium]|nr:nucleotidyltransferase family protein [Stellaceae bacterium]
MDRGDGNASAGAASKRGPASYLWPSCQQTLLLIAATSEGTDAVTCFRKWRHSVDLDADFDRGTYRLLPLVYDNIRRLGVQDPLMGRLKGVYRMSWYENHVLFDKVRPIVSHLEENGVRTLLLKGVPLVLTYYRNPAVRPMADVDIVVPPAQVRRAIAAIEALGWRRNESASDDDLKYRHSMQFTDRKDLQFDLHWHFLYEACNGDADEFFWASALPLDFGGVPTLQLDAEAMLIHVVLHGIRWNAEPPIRWIPDALSILRREACRFDWERVIAFAAAQRLTHRLGLGLHYLADRHGAPIPPKVLSCLQRARVTLLERIENTVVLRDRERIYANPLGKQWVIFVEYCRWTAATGPIDFVVGLSHYVRYRWKLKGRMELVPTIFRGLRRRFAKMWS